MIPGGCSAQVSSHASKTHYMFLAQLVAEGCPLPIILLSANYGTSVLASPAPICLRPF